MRILFTGGGTGGHIFPIIAIKEALPADCESRYLGPDGFAKNNLGDIKSKFIFAGKLHRYFTPIILIEFLKTILGIIQSLFKLFVWIPDVIFAKGGYGSFPVVFAARIYRIPVIVHDSDAIPGLANKKIAKHAKKIILSFESAKKYFRPKDQNKIIVIGNPIRKELLCEGQTCLPAGREIFKISSSKPVILILGGSQGAQKINEIVINFLPRLLELAEIIHSCGAENYKFVEKEAPKSPEYHLYPFLDTGLEKYAYALADLIINRAGAGSIFEIAALGKASILIPLPNSAQNHQRENAFEFSNKGIRAIVLDQENLTPNLLLEQISNLLSNPELMKKMGESARSFYNPQTPELIRDEILKFARA